MNTRTIESHTTVWRGITLKISYEPHWLNSQALVQPAHLQIESVAPIRAPLPITETGYRSWFTSPALVAETDGPVAFVLQLLEAAGGRVWQQQEADRRQLDLFG